MVTPIMRNHTTPSIDLDQAAKLAVEIELETLYNKNQLIQRIHSEFVASEFPFAEYMESREIPEDFGFALLVQMVLHKRTTLSTLVGILRRYSETCQQAADLLYRAAEADLVDWDPISQNFIVVFNITKEVQDDLDRYQFPLPMIVEPRALHSNRDTPYIRVKDGSVILKKNHHDDDVCLDHLNRVNAVRFALDMNTANMIANRWRNLDKPKAGETRFDFEKRKKAFEKYDRTAREVMAKVTSLGNEFYLTHKYDKRGRIYCQGYHINYQGAAWNKAVVELADREFID